MSLLGVVVLGRFFCPLPARAGERIELPPEEAHHVLTALRGKVGQKLILFDGQGRESQATIAHIRKRTVQVETARPVRSYPFDIGYRVTRAVAMPRAHRQSYLVEKCTELGVAALWPMTTARSTAKPVGSTTQKWQRRTIEAAKQSGRRWVPAVSSPQPFAACAGRCGEYEATAFADTESGLPSFTAFLAERAKGSAVLVFVGPEGGWTDEERTHAGDAGARGVRLSPTVLRVETAAVSVCAAAAMASL